VSALRSSSLRKPERTISPTESAQSEIARNFCRLLNESGYNMELDGSVLNDTERKLPRLSARASKGPCFISSPSRRVRHSHRYHLRSGQGTVLLLACFSSCYARAVRDGPTAMPNTVAAKARLEAWLIPSWLRSHQYRASFQQPLWTQASPVPTHCRSARGVNQSTPRDPYVVDPAAA
jgi:hypothetical protein